MSIYQEIILDHYRNPRNNGKLDHATNACHLTNPLCGDDITMNVIVENEKVNDISFEGQGCAIAIASASIVTELAKGKSISELKKWDKSVILNEIGIELSPNRLKCALLPLEVLQKAITT